MTTQEQIAPHDVARAGLRLRFRRNSPWRRLVHRRHGGATLGSIGSVRRSLDLLTAGTAGASGAALLLGSPGAGLVSFAAAAGLLSLGRGAEQPAPPASTSGWSEFARELERSRRSGEPLSLLRLRPPVDSPPLGELLVEAHKSLRVSASAFHGDGDVLIVLPGADRVGASCVAHRIVESAGLPPSVAQTAGTATFPTDGLTLASLIRASRAMPALRPTTRISDDEPGLL